MCRRSLGDPALRPCSFGRTNTRGAPKNKWARPRRAYPVPPAASREYKIVPPIHALEIPANTAEPGVGLSSGQREFAFLFVLIIIIDIDFVRL